MSNYKYIFGPVPSRRLGLSLGADVIPFKTCSFDCVYCELGRTTNKTVERKEYIPLEDIKRELTEKLKENIKIDYITIAGSGEPTLYSKLGELIDFIKSVTDIPAAILTNGSLLWDEKVRDDIKNADLVKPSLDFWDDDSFQKVNRPEKQLSREKIIEGLIEFSHGFKNKIWLEVFLLKDTAMNDGKIDIIAQIVNKMRVDKVQLNSVDRPPAESYAKAPTAEEMNRYKTFFKHKDVEIIYKFQPKIESDNVVDKFDVINLLRRRPCSIDDIASGLQINRNEATKLANKLLEEKEAQVETVEGKNFIALTNKKKTPH
ncbi:MAG TPA: radical SAM protein [Spirochaetota bacterium]|nr:radical SAM protein [Spirochaetota bacterium]HOS32613.1 radical SAM protein [Spirochaetota bacterium]HOS55946.1 radical SAM protein [Spirochaetota bacterium]HPK61642.1 radical SAM protein [Spirochaetota bacterium]HQF77944.1 radical SAM protein [Spirochaetota bacterium]